MRDDEVVGKAGMASPALATLAALATRRCFLRARAFLPPIVEGVVVRVVVRRDFREMRYNEKKSHDCSSPLITHAVSVGKSII